MSVGQDSRRVTEPAAQRTDSASSQQAVSAIEVIDRWLELSRSPPPGLRRSGCTIADISVSIGACSGGVAQRVAERLVRTVESAGGPINIYLIETEIVGWPGPPSIDDIPLLRRQLAARGIAAIYLPADAIVPDPVWILSAEGEDSALVVTRSATDMPSWMVDAPVTMALSVILGSRGLSILHAAGVGHQGRGVLIGGAGGAGKSATTLSATQCGLDTVGDDYVVLDDGPPPRLHSLYKLMKQTPQGLGRFPDLLARCAQLPLNWHGKVEFEASLVRPGCMADALEPTAILIPNQAFGSRTSFTPVSPADAFSALAATTVSQLPGSATRVFSSLTRLTRTLPSFRINLGTDADEVGTSLRHFIENGP